MTFPAPALCGAASFLSAASSGFSAVGRPFENTAFPKQYQLSTRVMDLRKKCVILKSGQVMITPLRSVQDDKPK